MSSMNILAALTLSTLMAIAGQAFAEPQTCDQKDMDRMERNLDLSPDQAQKVRTIVQEQAEKRRALEEETRKRLSTVLNAEQMERMEKFAHQRNERRGERMGEHMAEKLDLTPEQKAAVDKIFADTQGEFAAMDKSDLDREQKRAQMDALHAQTRDKLAKILNQDQLARFDAMHSRHMSRRDPMGNHEERRERRSSDAGSDSAQDDALQSEPE